MVKSFLNSTSPFITEMVQVPTIAQAKDKFKTAIQNGATAIGFQMHVLNHEFRSQEVLTSLFDLAQDKPIYFTNYRGGLNDGKTDDELANGLFLGLKCGATIVDVMGDMFCPSIDELTTDTVAIKKQIDLINKIHDFGGEVLMSSHVQKFRTPERVLEMALAQQQRGADVVKIVTGADTKEEELKNLEICHLLKKELKVPFLFLSGGAFNKLHRNIGPALGVCMWLCFSNYDETTYVGPPLIQDVIKIKDGLKL
jgi:3-dehydroquinate dehydratase